MKLLVLLSVTLALYVHSASAGGFMDAAKLMGIDVPPECKKIMEEDMDAHKKRCWKFLQDECKATKCKWTFKQLWAEGGYDVVKCVANTVIADMKKDMGLDLYKGEGKCATFDKDIAGVMWKFVDEVIAECVTGDKSPGKKLENKDPCKIKEEELKDVKECCKGKAMPKAMDIAMPKMDQGKACANAMMKKHCTKAKAGKFMDKHMKTAITDKKIASPCNAFEIIKKSMKSCKVETKS